MYTSLVNGLLVPRGVEITTLYLSPLSAPSDKSGVVYVGVPSPEPVPFGTLAQVFPAAC